MIGRLFRQLHYRRVLDRRQSWFGNLRMGLRFNCFVAPKALIYHADRIQLANDVQIHERAMLNYRSGTGDHRPNLIIGEGTKIMPDAKLVPQQGYIRIGKNCSIQYGCLLYGVGGLEIGDDSRIAAHTVITPMNHVYTDPSRPIRVQGETALGIRIGRDVWIGSGAKILDGVTIGDGCVVGAGAVVTKNIPAFSIAVGVPARVVGHRQH